MWRNSTQHLSADIQPDELISTFAYDLRHIDRQTNTIRHTRLMPRRNHNTSRLESSVCRSTQLSEEQVWTICADHFDAYSPKPAIGRGVGPASAIAAVGLALDADGVPYKEHANIIGWFDKPNTPDNELKHYWIDHAQKIAERFKYFARP